MTSQNTPDNRTEQPSCVPQPPFDAFIFDLDGTLLDTLPDLVVLTNSALADMGFPPRTTEEIHSYVGDGAKALIVQAVPDGTSEDQTEATVKHWRAMYDQFPNDLTEPYEGIEDMARELKRRGCRIGVLSNKFDGGVKFIMGKCLPDLFEVEHGEDPEHGFPRKPDPAGLLKTIAELDSEPARCAYVGDSPGDVEVARRAGCYAVAVTWGYHESEDFAAEGWEPDFMAHEPADLLALTCENYSSC